MLAICECHVTAQRASERVSHAHPSARRPVAQSHNRAAGHSHGQRPLQAAVAMADSATKKRALAAATDDEPASDQ